MNNSEKHRLLLSVDTIDRLSVCATLLHQLHRSTLERQSFGSVAGAAVSGVVGAIRRFTQSVDTRETTSQADPNNIVSADHINESNNGRPASDEGNVETSNES